jgi:peptide/nickel transport system substrate-binding protein
MIEEARSQFDADRRRELCGQFQALLHEEQPYTFMYYADEGAAYSRRFRGVEFLPPQPGVDLTKWWVPTGLQRFTDFTP